MSQAPVKVSATLRGDNPVTTTGAPQGADEMTSPARFFEDNLQRISPSSDPVAYNLNQGLLAMAKQLAAMQVQMQYLRSEIQDVERRIQRLPQ